jgi:hypothetical protein
MLTTAIASCPDSQPADEARFREVMPAEELPQADGGTVGLEAIEWIVTPAQLVASWAIPALAARQMLQQAGFPVGREDSELTVRFKLLAATWVGESRRSVQHFRQLAAPVQQAMTVALGLDGSEDSDTQDGYIHALFSLCRQSEWAQDPTLSRGLITPARCSVLNLLREMQDQEEDPRDRLLDNVSPAELRHSNFGLFGAEDEDSHTGMERWMRREGHRQARHWHLPIPDARATNDYAFASRVKYFTITNIVRGEGGPGEEGPDFQQVANGGISNTSTGVSEGSGPEDLSRPSHLASAAP